MVDRVAPAHGDVTLVTHDGCGVFAGVPQEFKAVRYHSLAALSVPDALVVTARGDDGTVMGVRHRSLPLEGVQFHPESILSEHGALLVANFLGLPGGTRWVTRWMTSSPSSPRSLPSTRAASGSTVAAPGSGRGAVRWSAGSTTTTSRSPSTPARARYAVTPRGRVEVVGSDVFEVLEAELAAGSPDDQWFGYFGYAARPDLFPARPDPDLPDAVWMRCSQLRFFDHGPLGTSYESSLHPPRFA